MKLFVDGEEVELLPSEARISAISDRVIVKTAGGSYSALTVRAGDSVLVSYKGRQYKLERKRPPRLPAHGLAASGEIRAPMPGQIVDVLTKVDANLKKGDKILVLEAMKTQQAFISPFDGSVESLSARKGSQVGEGELLAVIRPLDESGEQAP